MYEVVSVEEWERRGRPRAAWFSCLENAQFQVDSFDKLNHLFWCPAGRQPSWTAGAAIIKVSGAPPAAANVLVKTGPDAYAWTPALPEVVDEFWDVRYDGWSVRQILRAYEAQQRECGFVDDGVLVDDILGPAGSVRRQLAKKAWARRLDEIDAARKDRARRQVVVQPELEAWE